MKSNLRIAVLMTLATTVLLGIAYPLAVTGLAQLLFPARANGSLLAPSGTVVGSRLLGQAFAAPGYFHPRPSAAGSGYDATSSGGSNLGPTNQKLVDRVKQSVEQLQKDNPGKPVPIDLVTTSASGLDPDISPSGAEFQVKRVAEARGLPEQAVREIVSRHTRGRQLGFVGEPRVNVLELNLDLDRVSPLAKR